MDTLEASKVLAVLNAAYTRNISESDAVALVRIWSHIFEDIPYGEVGEAVMDFIKNDTKGYMPLPGQIMEIVNTRRAEATGRLIEMQFASQLELNASAQALQGGDDCGE